MRRLIPLAAVLAAALALAACGQTESSAEKFRGEEKRVADVIEDLQSAGEKKDADKICNDILSRSLVQQVRAAGSDCASEMDKTIKDADDFELEVQAVTVRGTTATARVKGNAGKDRRDPVRTFSFVKESGQWRATALG
jgi:hypothetical protein